MSMYLILLEVASSFQQAQRTVIYFFAAHFREAVRPYYEDAALDGAAQQPWVDP